MRIKYFSKVLTVCLVVCLTVVGCSSKVSTINGFTPEKLGKIGAAVDHHPDQAEAILSHNNLTREEFREAVKRIASNPELSRRYHQSFRAMKKTLD